MNKFLNVFVRAALVWVVFALTFQVTMIALVVVNPELVKKISHELSWKFDGTFNK